MNLTVQAIVMGLVQGLTEFLPISSSGHLVIVPYLLHWQDPFITSLAFSVILHLGTLVALLVYFWRDWLELVPAGLAVIRDRSFHDPRAPLAPPPTAGAWEPPGAARSGSPAFGGSAPEPHRRLAWLIVVTTIPAIVVGPVFGDALEAAVRRPGVVAVTLVVGGALMWLADRWGRKARGIDQLTFAGAFGIGLAQILALVPGISRSGVSISAGLFLGLDREAAARFSFLMAAPVIAGAGLWEARKLIGPGAEAVPLVPLAAGFVASLVAGLAAIHFLLGYLRRHSMNLFVGYRIVLAAFVAIALLA